MDAGKDSGGGETAVAGKEFSCLVLDAHEIEWYEHTGQRQRSCGYSSS
jgi:hypothetical protein